MLSLKSKTWHHTPGSWQQTQAKNHAAMRTKSRRHHHHCKAVDWYLLRHLNSTLPNDCLWIIWSGITRGVTMDRTNRNLFPMGNDYTGHGGYESDPHWVWYHFTLEYNIFLMPNNRVTYQASTHLRSMDYYFLHRMIAWYPILYIIFPETPVAAKHVT
jgi:hypothetical protein